MNTENNLRDLNEFEIQKAIDEAYKAMHDYEIGIIKYNEQLLKDNNISSTSVKALIDDCRVTDKMEIVEIPGGEDQEEGRGKFKQVWVDQWSVGDSGDSYAGFIYGKISDNKWLKIPYDC